MPRFRRITSLVLMVSISSLFMTIRVMAIPLLPSSFYGTVKVNDQNVPDGTLVLALIDGQVYAEAYSQTYQGDSVYALDLPSDNADTAQIEGGRDNDTIQFEIGGVLTAQTGTWKSGTNVNLDLAVVVTTPIYTPQVLPTRIASQTPIKTKQPLPTATVFTQPSSIPSSEPQLVSTIAPQAGPSQIPSLTDQAVLTNTPLTELIVVPSPTNQSLSTTTPPTKLSQRLERLVQPPLIKTKLVNSYPIDKASTIIEEENSAVTLFGIILMALVLGIIILILTGGRKTLLKSSEKSDHNQNDKEV